jgi:hypothetical protein
MGCMSNSPLFEPQSRGILLGKPIGLLPDGWVRKQAIFDFLALDLVTSVSIEMWMPSGREPLSLTMKAPDGPEVTLIAPSGLVAVLQYAVRIVPLAKLRLIFAASHEYQLSAVDRRRASYRLRCLSLQ